MEIALERKSKRCFKRLREQELVCDTSCESVVPDTQEDIRQILGASFITRLRSKEIEAGEICVKAELDATVLYFSDNGVESLTMTLPLSAKLPSNDADSSCRLTAEIRVCSWDARLINPRKLSVTVNATVNLLCFKENELVWYGEPVSTPEKLFIKTESKSVMLIDTVAEKEISVSEDFELALGEGAKLVSASAKYCAVGNEAVGDRLIVRCRADIEAIFIRDGKILRESFSLPFSQLFDIDGNGKGQCSICSVSTGEYYDYCDGKLSAELHTALQLIYWKSTELQYSSDAYSCINELSTDFESLELCSDIIELCEKESVELSFEPQQELSELVMTRAAVSTLERTSEGIKAAVAAEIIYRDTDKELRCGRVRGTVQFAIEGINLCRLINCELSTLRVAESGKTVEVRAELRLDAVQEQYSEALLLTAIEEGESLISTPHSAYVVISDEDIWNVAKKYRSAANMIKEISSSDSGKTKYFVPAIS